MVNINSNCENGHRFTGLSSRLLRREGISEIVQCVDCIAVRVTLTPNDRPSIVTVVEAPNADKV